MDFRGFAPFMRSDMLPDLLPIIPPHAPLAPYSQLTSANLGKTPGIPTEDGWQGFPDWTKHKTTVEDIESWLKVLDGAPFNVGLNARTYHAIDVDTADHEFANAVLASLQAQMKASLAMTGVRVGRAPGFLVPFKPVEPMRKKRQVFKNAQGETSVVELLGVGQQYVLAGQHPSGVPYRWYPVERFFH